MPIIVNLDVMMAKRKMSLNELSEKVGLTLANLSILKTGKAKALKLINKGYRITADKTFFEKDDSREACNWDSVVALFRRYGIEYIPEGLVKSL